VGKRIYFFRRARKTERGREVEESRLTSTIRVSSFISLLSSSLWLQEAS